MDLSPLTPSRPGSHGVASSPHAHSGVEALYATGYWLLAHERVEDAAKVFRVMLHAAPRDERGWLGLGECHERAGQCRIALELYGAGSVVAESPVRCLLARAHVLRADGFGGEADQAFDQAEKLATARSDDELMDLVERARKWKP